MPRINVSVGYTPGAIGAIVALHAKHYGGGANLGLAFEAKIATDLSSFLVEMDSTHDLFLVATVHGTIVGSLAVDGHTSGTEEAQLRWFVLHPLYNPDEVCSALVAEAIRFCRGRNYRRVVLMTAANSEITRKLTRDWGFQLVGESETRDWRTPLRQQRFELADRPSG
jgi:N-acetylglutamate synthase-like GNAT family acetyltransferase